MNRQGTCHDNARTESFVQLPKRERIKQRIYPTRDAARSDDFDYIEMFYDSRWRHVFNDQLSPEKYENRFPKRPASV